MVEIVPRWEWRIFAKEIVIRIDLDAFEHTRHVKSSETYLVSGAALGNPKIRDGKMDIKILEHVNDIGLEQWKPEMKAAFPLSKDQVIAVYDALNVPPVILDRADYDLEAFLAVMDADSRVRAVRVEKFRDEYDVEGCTVELSEVIFDGERFKTISAENASPDLVFSIVGMLGLQSEENMNYVKFIKFFKGLS